MRFVANQTFSGETMTSLPLNLEQIATPLGTLLIVSDDREHLRAVDWSDHEDRMHALMRRYYRGREIRLTPRSAPTAAAEALAAYFDGSLSAIDALKTHTEGTAFQKDVWRALCDIPCGHPITYGELARRIDRPRAVRAVGAAIGANPVSIVIPCHRVIGSQGRLTGYGGGLDRKRWLLQHEDQNNEGRPA